MEPRLCVFFFLTLFAFASHGTAEYTGTPSTLVLSGSAMWAPLRLEDASTSVGFRDKQR